AVTDGSGGNVPCYPLSDQRGGYSIPPSGIVNRHQQSGSAGHVQVTADFADALNHAAARDLLLYVQSGGLQPRRLQTAIACRDITVEISRLRHVFPSSGIWATGALCRFQDAGGKYRYVEH